MLIILMILVLATVSVRAASVFDAYKDEWATFKMQYGKAYENDREDEFRLQVYVNNSRYVNENNKLYDEGKVSFKLGINRFSDMLQEEIEKSMGMQNYISNLDGYNSHGYTMCERYKFRKPSTKQRKLDWRTMGAVTPVKSQGRYGGCWAFSATGALESHYFLKTKKLVRLSEQNLIDCIRRPSEGGFASQAFQYVIRNRGINAEAYYPYKERNNWHCYYNKQYPVMNITGCGQVISANEKQLKYALEKVGPISVALVAYTRAFNHYRSGILFTRECFNGVPNHAVLLVGYGTEHGQDYWLAKNSWGADWGDHGYFKIARNKHNHCGIASDACFPIS